MTIKVIDFNNGITSENILYKLGCIAHVCYAKDDMEKVKENISSDKQLKLVLQILKSGHNSILEHVSLTFGVEGISRNCTHQIVRHRNMSFAQQSFHYTIADSLDIPDIVCNSIDTIQILQHAKTLLSEIHSVYKNLISLGMKRDDARHILPGGQLTRIYITANIRQWIYFINERTCNRNCDEIKEVATLIQNKLIILMPFLEKHLGPDCKVKGICQEAIPCSIQKQKSL